MAGIGMWCLLADGEPGAEVYAAASMKSQAMVLFRDAVAMFRQSPALAARLTPSGGNPIWNLADLKTGSFFRPISSEDGQSGPRPHCALVDEVHERGIALELCLTSNVQTRATDRYETHPLKQFLARGMNVCLNTDNRLMSGTTLVDEYHHAATHCDCTFDELAGMALDGFRSSFLPDAEKLAMVARMEAEIGAIRAGASA
jgi:hypothetical protein